MVTLDVVTRVHGHTGGRHGCPRGSLVVGRGMEQSRSGSGAILRIVFGGDYYGGDWDPMYVHGHLR